MKKFLGFTLAEVLITLGIIGVVAALTMPVLLAKYKHKALESQFKRVYSELSQIAMSARNEFQTCPYSDNAEIRKFIISQYPGADIKDFQNRYNYSTFHTYTRKETNVAFHYNMLSRGTDYLYLPTGAYIALGRHNSVSNTTLISVDINGPKKGPNAFGHDIFFFTITSECIFKPVTLITRDCTDEDKDSGSCNEEGWLNESGPCSADSDSSTNGLLCGTYAISNTCPNNKGKNYWDCLP